MDGVGWRGLSHLEIFHLFGDGTDQFCFSNIVEFRMSGNYGCNYPTPVPNVPYFLQKLIYNRHHYPMDAV